MSLMKVGYINYHRKEDRNMMGYVLFSFGLFSVQNVFSVAQLLCSLN